MPALVSSFERRQTKMIPMMTRAISERMRQCAPTNTMAVGGARGGPCWRPTSSTEIQRSLGVSAVSLGASNLEGQGTLRQDRPAYEADERVTKATSGVDVG